MIIRSISTLAVFLFAAGCGGDAEPQTDTDGTSGIVLNSDWDARISAEELERGRRDPAWTRVVELDSIDSAGVVSSESWEDITASAVNTGATHLPLYGDVGGPSVLRAQILLDRVLFSPGVIDGRWGKNTEKAAFWFQRREGLRATGRIDEATLERLVELAGSTPELARSHQLTEEDVEGPFVQIPEDIYEKAELDCLCYESLSEKLAENFHTTPDLLAKLNPGVDLNGLGAGDALNVPNVRSPSGSMGAQVSRLVVSAEGFYVHALDSAGRILYHFPSTLGSSFDPSPTGDHSIERIAKDPWWHYQPSILEHVDDDEPEAKLPPGPNNAVGAVWMALSIPHYGIHGTSAPETIGYTTSAGCVRLTNWDALFLADRVQEGVPVEFSRAS